MTKKKIIKIIFVLVFIIASLMRISLAIVNRDANDNHFKVVRIIANENRIPNEKEPECLQCYHPKLYHYIAAKAVNLFSVHSENTTEKQKIIMQMLNALVGVLTLVFVFKFLKKINFSDTSSLITFSLIALNPALIGINAQATNDTFVIFFSTLALYFLYLFLKNNFWRDLICLSFAVALASLSKGSGLIIFFGIFIIFLLKLIANLENIIEIKKWIFRIVLFFVICFPLIAFFGPYANYVKIYKTPFVLNKPKSSFPNFLKRTYEGNKTGVTSIADAYFTFRIFDLFQNPYLNRENNPEKYSLNRMSLWTQLYARNNFVQFEGVPKQWIVKISNPIYYLGKMIFVFALLPLAIFLYGIFRVMKKLIYNLWKDKFQYIAKANDWIFILFFWVFFVFIIKFTLDYRDFTSMKPIYLFPGILSFVYIFGIGCEDIYEKIKKSKYIQYGLCLFIIILLLFYIADVAYLIRKIS